MGHTTRDGRPRPPHPPGRRRAVDPDAAVLSAAQGRLRGGPGQRRPRGARALRRADLRPRRPRRDDAQARRARGLPPPARQEHRADHHAHGQGRGDRQGPRPRDRRRRLHHQALLAAGVPQPRPGRAAPRRDESRAPRERRGRAARGPRAAHRAGQAHRHRPRRGHPRHLRGVRDPLRPRPQPRPGVHARDAAHPHLGDSAFRDPRTIDVHIRHLREKLERDAKDPEYLFTVRGVGYRFRDTGQ